MITSYDSYEDYVKTLPPYTLEQTQKQIEKIAYLREKIERWSASDPTITVAQRSYLLTLKPQLRDAEMLLKHRGQKVGE